jgi:putative ABC transport system substrate-binding protein
LWPVEISTPDDIEPVFAKIVQDRADGIVRGPGAALFNWRARIGAAALKHRLPAMTYIAEEVPHGFLMSYGQDTPDFFRRTAVYVDKILKGAKPADLPVEQPTKFKLVLRAFSRLMESAGFSLSRIRDSSYVSNRHGGFDGQGLFSGLA